MTGRGEIGIKSENEPEGTEACTNIHQLNITVVNNNNVGGWKHLGKIGRGENEKGCCVIGCSVCWRGKEEEEEEECSVLSVCWQNRKEQRNNDSAGNGATENWQDHVSLAKVIESLSNEFRHQNHQLFKARGEWRDNNLITKWITTALLGWTNRKKTTGLRTVALMWHSFPSLRWHLPYPVFPTGCFCI